MITTRRFGVDEWKLYREIRLRALADAPDAFGSTLEIEQMRPDTMWQERIANAAHSPLQFPLVAEYSGEPIGLAWIKVNSEATNITNIYQMWVAPNHRGAGAGVIILDCLIAWARTTNADCVELDVVCDNSAAVRLYAKAGFVKFGGFEQLRPGSPLLSQKMRLNLKRAGD